MIKTYEVAKIYEIAAEPETCYRVLCDFESYPEWFTFVRMAEVEERDMDGHPVRVRFTIDMALKHGISVVQHFRHNHRQRELMFYAAEGGPAGAEGSFRFNPMAEGGTETHYRVKISHGLFLPPALANYMIERTLGQALGMLGAESVRSERLFFR